MKIIHFDFQRRVRYFEVDKMGYVHNSNVFRYFENGREETMRHFGLSYFDIEKQGVMMPLVEQYCHYHIPAAYDDLITIRTTIKAMPTAKIRFDYEIFSIKNCNKVLNYEGFNILCFVDLVSRKPMRCPNFIKEFFEKILSNR